MTRAVVCVATTPHYQKGLARLRGSQFISASEPWMFARTPEGSPNHSDVPYAFKAFALRSAVINYNADLLLWCDSSILLIRSLEPLWERIERDGYWISRNGWTNYEWTAQAAYDDLFASEIRNNWAFQQRSTPTQELESINRTISHVVATAFGLNMRHPKGKAFLDEYYRLASETKAFCGPWVNSNYSNSFGPGRGAPCGPSDVLGHRHDQTAASAIAWRLGMQLTDPPNIFAYSKRRPDGTLHLSDQDERTILLADGSLHDGVVHA